jgi:hypothetical protein
MYRVAPFSNATAFIALVSSTDISKLRVFPAKL